MIAVTGITKRYGDTLSVISEGAQFVKGVPEAPLAVDPAQIAGGVVTDGRAEAALAVARDRGGRSRPAAGRPQGKPGGTGQLQFTSWKVKPVRAS